jgi:Carbon-nitrogen hydrolase
MRILLAAVNAQKGDLDGNLARHLAVLDQARAQGCDVAVFPELSLTGSVDPNRHPERTLTLDAEPVRAVVEASTRSARPSAAWSSTTPAGRCCSATPTPGSTAPGGARRAAASTRARTTWPRSAASFGRSWPATTSSSAPGSAGAAAPSGWGGG